MTGVQNLGQTLKTVREQLDVAAYNLERAGDPTARTINSSLSVDQLGNGNTHRVRVIESRASNPLQERIYTEQVTKLENANTYTEFLVDLQSVVGNSEDPNKSQFVTSINKFFDQANKLATNNNLATKKTFVETAESLGKIISSASEKINELRLEADRGIQKNTMSANKVIKDLFNLNHAMLISANSIRHQDQRDNLVKELAQHFAIKVNYDKNGTVNIRSKSGGEQLVSNTNYAEFSYKGLSNVNQLINHDEFAPITINQFDSSGKQVSTRQFADFNKQDVCFSGGRWSALVDLRDNVLPEAGDKIKALGSNVAKQVNEIHNNGSPFPPKGFFESSRDISNRDIVDLEKSFTINFVTKQADQLQSEGRRLTPALIDIPKLNSSIASGKASVADIIKELNNQLKLFPVANNPSAFGEIQNDQGVAIDEHLVNHVQLRVTRPLDATDNNSLEFNINLHGNSYFDSQIEVLGIETADNAAGNNSNALDFNMLPGVTPLAKGTNTTIDNNIRVENAVGGRFINVTLRVTGKNGSVAEHAVHFELPNEIADMTANDFLQVQNLPAAHHSQVAHAMLVDENNVKIDPNSGQQGKLQIRTNDDNYRLAIQGGDFGAKFGFNNLFEFNNNSGKLEVNPEIAQDADKLSLGLVEKDAGVTKACTVGDQKSGITLGFVNIGGIVAGDTITITDNNGTAHLFQFVNGLPANQDQIQIQQPNTAQNIADAINNHSWLKGLVSATVEGDEVQIKAKAAGDQYNAIRIQSALAAGAQISVNGVPAVNNINTLLQGGSNKIESTEIFNYTIKPNSLQLLKQIGDLQKKITNLSDGSGGHILASLPSLASIVTTSLSDLVNNAKKASDVATNVLQLTDNQIKKDSGISKEDQYLQALDLARLMSNLAQFMQMVQSTTIKVEDILFR